ncbi:MAG TPA: tripartite tricarboxylate transporter TctB family protein [Beijerinckiaceae bacterium]|nr:tripartite tricarboxylate transporter TctB family protein [Beijerinckiaceae bacterium]
MDPQPTRRPGETVFTVMMLLLSIFLLWNAYKISGFSSKSSPGAFPLAATLVMVVAGLVAVFNTLRLPEGPKGFSAFRSQVAPNLVLAFAGLILFYGLALESVGFILTSLAFLFAGMLLLHRQGIGRSLMYSVLSLALVYVTFRLVFKVVLPEGIIPERRILAEIGAVLGPYLGVR